jgi:hypothetical protein
MIKLNIVTVPAEACAALLGKVHGLPGDQDSVLGKSRGFSFPYHIRIGSEAHQASVSNCYTAK